jgi:hypothetical protein
LHISAIPNNTIQINLTPYTSFLLSQALPIAAPGQAMFLLRGLHQNQLLSGGGCFSSVLLGCAMQGGKLAKDIQRWKSTER